jgi:gliding motility-associated-like protein
LPVIAAVGSTICALKTISLSASGGTAFAWSGPNGFVSTSPQEFITNADLSQQGDYSVTVTDNNGCTSTSVTNVHVNAIPTLTASANTPICVNQTISLSAGALTGTSYLWQGPNGFYSIKQNDQITEANSLSSGIYTVTVTDNIGCSSQAMVNMQVNQLPVVSISSDKRSGCVPVCITFSPQSSTSIQSCYWKFGDGSSAGGLTVQKCYTSPGSFEVSSKFTDINGCTNTGTFNVETYPIPAADFNYASAKPIINETVEFTDASSGANITSWIWNFSHLKNQVALKPQTSMVYENPGTYVVALIVMSDHGCRDTAVRSITIGDDFGIFVPDAFTPNGDGLNDIFQPKGYGIVKYELNIFDRWGERMFTSSDFEKGWDGSFVRRGDDLVKEDIYIWNIKMVTVFGKAKELSGKVTLIR